jgi:lipoprotein-anchoring transpeptidase ErfK/SrfK
MLAKRFSLIALAFLLGACQPSEHSLSPSAFDNLDGWYTGLLPDQPFDIPLVNKARIDPVFLRQQVSYSGPEDPGTIVVDIVNRVLYFVEGGG